ncbi:hypothetical protein GCM10010932_02490 [Agromyces flavus]|nr:hypothetical protein GCM10010932_02490 [Agromyces flavus]
MRAHRRTEAVSPRHPDLSRRDHQATRAWDDRLMAVERSVWRWVALAVGAALAVVLAGLIVFIALIP